MKNPLALPDSHRNRRGCFRRASHRYGCLLFIGAALVWLLFPRPNRASLDNGPEIFYEAFGAEPPRRLVSDLQGSEKCWLDCFMWLRFRSSDAFRQFLLHQGFRAFPCTDLSLPLLHPSAYSPPDPFFPAWNPAGAEPCECYTRERLHAKQVWRTDVQRGLHSRVTHTFLSSGPLH